MELKEFWYVLLKRKWIAAATFLLVFGAVIVYMLTCVPLYEGTVKLLLTEDRTKSVLGQMSAMTDLLAEGTNRQDAMASQMEVIKTRPMMIAVRERLATVYRRTTPLTDEQLINAFKISNIKSTNVITISYQHPDPAYARDMLNALSEVAVAQNRQYTQEDLSMARQFIEKELERQKNRLQEAETAMLQMKNKQKSVSIEQETAARVNALVELESQKAKTDSELDGALAQQAGLSQKLAERGASSSSFYPAWMAQMDALSSTISSLKAQQSGVLVQMAKLQSQLKKLPPKEVQLARVLREQKISSDIYSSLLVRYQEVQINEAAQMGSLRIIEPAIAPKDPVFPDKKRLLLKGAVAGLLLGFGLVLLLEYIHDAPQSIDQVKDLTKVPVIGLIPQHKFKTLSLVAQHSQTAVAEVFRLIRTNLKFIPAVNHPGSVLMITSGGDSEGKTTVAVNLAEAYREVNKKVLVINLDLRLPALNAHYDLTGKDGLTDYLTGNLKIADIMFEKNGVYVIPSGTIPPNPSALLASERLVQLIEELKSKFDLVILDTPPVTLVSETLELMQHADGILLVVSMLNSSISRLKHTISFLENKQLPILGLLINKVRYARGYDKAYSRYYKAEK